MKISLKSKDKDCRAYGLTFDSGGVCDCDPKVVESLLDAGLVVEAKKKPVKIKVTKK